MKKAKNVLMMIGDVNKIFHTEIRRRAEECGLPASYHPIILALSYRDGLTQLDLVRFTRFKAPTISLTLQKMEQENYVIRKASNDDARKIQVFLTEKGHAYEYKILEIIDNLENSVLTRLNDDEKKNLEHILKNLIKIMCEEFGVYSNENI